MFLVVTARGNFLYLFTTQICQLPSVITMTIAATRMYRSLTNFSTSTTEVYKYSSSLLLRLMLTTISRNSDSKISKLRWNKTPFNRIHVTVDTIPEHNQVSLTSHPDSHMSTVEQPCNSDSADEFAPRAQPKEPV